MNEIDRDLDLVLYAFMDAAPEPTDTDVLEWQKRFPRFAKDILDHAEAAKSCNAAASSSQADMVDAEAEAYGGMGSPLGSGRSQASTTERPKATRTKAMSEREDEASSRKTVLTDFMTECPTPTASDVRRWVKKYPAQAVEIGELAATLIELSIYRSPGPLATPTEAELKRAYALSVQTMRELGVDLGETSASFKDIVAQAGISVPQMELETGVPREVIGAMEAGWMSPPVGPRMLAAIAATLKVERETVAAAIAAAAAAPRAATAKATERPTVTQRTYRQIIEDSSMSEEQKAYWLGED